MYSRRNSLFSLVSAAVLMLLAAGAQADTISVATGQSIQAAIDAAAPNDTILIGPGTYYENLQWHDKDLVIQGAGAGNTIINANLNGQGFGGFCLRTSGLSPSARLEGVTLTRGGVLKHLDWWDSWVIDAWGGGMTNDDSNPTIVRCAFAYNDVGGDTDNSIFGRGGGMYNVRSNPTILSCDFTHNYADQGGAIANQQSSPTVSDCTFTDNGGYYGVTIYSEDSHATITGCRFTGSGLWNQNTTATITACTFSNAQNADYNDSCPAPGIVVTDCVFEGCSRAMNSYNCTTVQAINCAFINSVSGGYRFYSAVCGEVVVTGCLFANNVNPGTDPSRQADYSGTAINCQGTNSLRMTNCTIVGNRGGLTPVLLAASNLTITNCIIWGNRGGLDLITLDDQNMSIYSSNPTVRYSDIERSEVYPGVGNINTDPLFVNPTAGDFRLRSGSPCINAGSNAAVPADVTTDLDGNARLSGSAVDLGAYEKFLDSVPPVITAPNSVNATATSAAGATVSFSASATDNVDGPVAVTCTPPSGSLFPLGTTTVTCQASDRAGNTATTSFTVTVTYSWSGVLQPINADGSSIFKAGSTVPVKFQLTGDSAAITNAVAKLSYTKVGDTSGTVNEATSTAAGDSGNQFRYDSTSKQYLFNWSTKGLSSGTYQLKVDLGDGVQTHTVNVGLK